MVNNNNITLVTVAVYTAQKIWYNSQLDLHKIFGKRATKST